MRTFRSVFWLVPTIILAACTKTEAPDFGAPLAIEIPTTGDVSGPRFSTGPDDRLLLSWMEASGSGTTLRYAALVNGKFLDPADVVTDAQMFVNWADLPSVTAFNEDHWIAHWLRYSAPKTYSYDVVVSQSQDGGKTWGAPLTAHSDDTQTEHGFVSIAPDPDGATLLWLDGRNTPDKSMTLRTALVTPGGRISREQELDDTVCDCCQTDVAITADGPIAVYRDRTSEEIRDIYVTRSLDGRWQPGRRLYPDNWKIPGCPVNGPSVVASGSKVAVAWFSAANDQPVVRILRSRDGGATFGDAIEIARGRIAGFVGLAMLEDESVAVSWVARNEDLTNTVLVRHVDTAGDPGPALSVGQSGQLRLFPQLAFVDGNLYVAWTDEVEGSKQLKVVRITVSNRGQSS